MAPMSGRSTADVILIALTIALCISIIVTGFGIIIIAVLHPEQNLSDAYRSFGNLLGLLVGAVVGYLAGKGRSATSREQQ
jgi:uncharacterized membrane protein (DUF441 family)